jgi:hypothetical protein
VEVDDVEAGIARTARRGDVQGRDPRQILLLRLEAVDQRHPGCLILLHRGLHPARAEIVGEAAGVEQLDAGQRVPAMHGVDHGA